MSYTHHATVRFFDVDRAGVAFFAGVFSLCHAAWEEVMALALAPASLEQALADGRWCLPVVRAEADFRAPMRLGERLTVVPRLHRMGARSLAVDYAVRGEADGEMRAEVRLVHAAASPGNHGARDGGRAAISEGLRARLLALLGDAS